MAYWFSIIFGTLTFALFLALFMLIIEHPKKWHIYSAIVFITFLIALTPLGFLPIALISSGTPLLFLILRELSFKTRLFYLALFVNVTLIFWFFMVPYLPIYAYPLLMAIFLLIIYLRNGIHYSAK